MISKLQHRVVARALMGMAMTFAAITGCSSHSAAPGASDQTDAGESSSSATANPSGGSTAGADCEPYPGDNPDLEQARNEVNALIQGAPENMYFMVLEWTVGHEWDSTYEALPDEAVATVSERICQRQASPKFQDMDTVYPGWYPDRLLGMSISETMLCADQWAQGRSSNEDLALCPTL